MSGKHTTSIVAVVCLVVLGAGCAEVIDRTREVETEVLSEEEYREQTRGELVRHSFDVEEGVVSARVRTEKVCHAKLRRKVREQTWSRRETKNVPVAIGLGVAFLGGGLAATVDAAGRESGGPQGPTGEGAQSLQYTVGATGILAGGGFLWNGIEVAGKGADRPSGEPETKTVVEDAGEAQQCGTTTPESGDFVAIYEETSKHSAHAVDRWERQDGQVSIDVAEKFDRLCDAPDRTAATGETDGASELTIRFESDETGDSIGLGSYDATDCLRLGSVQTTLDEAMSMQESWDDDKTDVVEPSYVLETIESLEAAGETLTELENGADARWVRAEAKRLAEPVDNTTKSLKTSLEPLVERALADLDEAFPQNPDGALESAKTALRAAPDSPMDPWTVWKRIYQGRCGDDEEKILACAPLYKRLVANHDATRRCALETDDSNSSETNDADCPDWFRPEQARKVLTNFESALTKPIDRATEQISEATADLKAHPTVNHYKSLQTHLETGAEMPSICSENFELFEGEKRACKKLVAAAEEAKQVAEEKGAEVTTAAWENLSRAKRGHLWRTCKQNVRDRLKAPSSADFSPFSEVSGGFLPSQDVKWHVMGWVDAENSYGAKLRSDVICSFRRVDGEFIYYNGRLTD